MKQTTEGRDHVNKSPRNDGSETIEHGDFGYLMEEAQEGEEDNSSNEKQGDAEGGPQDEEHEVEPSNRVLDAGEGEDFLDLMVEKVRGGGLAERELSHHETMSVRKGHTRRPKTARFFFRLAQRKRRAGVLTGKSTMGFPSSIFSLIMLIPIILLYSPASMSTLVLNSARRTMVN
jgi:hypothetical protein